MSATGSTAVPSAGVSPPQVPFHSGARSIARNSAFLVGTQLLSVGVRAIYLVVLARWLTPTDYGVLNYGLSWYLTLLVLTYLGLDVVLSREGGRDRDRARALLGPTLSLRGGAIGLVVFVSTGAALLFEGDATIRTLLLILGAALAGRSLWMWSAGVLTAFETTGAVPVIEGTFRLIEVVALIAWLLAMGPDLEAIAAIHGASWCLQGLASAILIHRRFGIAFEWPSTGALSLLVQGFPGAIFAFAMALFFQLPILLYRQWHGTDDALGHFALAFQIIAYLSAIPQVLAMASLPVLSRAAARRDDRARRLALWAFMGIPVAVGAIALLSRPIAGPLIGAAFGSQYLSAAAIVTDALWLLIPMSLALLLQKLFFATGSRAWLGSVAPLAGAGLMAALFFPLAEAFGDRGALLSIFVGMSGWTVCIAAALMAGGFFRRAGSHV